MFLLPFGIFAQSPCATQKHAEFDFWLGDWNVYDIQVDPIVGYNMITRSMKGCVIEEHWKGAGGFAGKSFNTYNPVDSSWNQIWVDQSGATYHFKGKIQNHAMVLKGTTVGKNGQEILFDLTYTPNQDDGSVRQVWRQSSTEGDSWKVIFDRTYRKK